MIVLGKQVGEVWKIPRIPPRASPSEEYSEVPDFSSLFTQDYISPSAKQTNNNLHGRGVRFVCVNNHAFVCRYLAEQSLL